MVCYKNQFGGGFNISESNLLEYFKSLSEWRDEQDTFYFNKKKDKFLLIFFFIFLTY